MATLFLYSVIETDRDGWLGEIVAVIRAALLTVASLVLSVVVECSTKVLKIDSCGITLGRIMIWISILCFWLAAFAAIMRIEM